MRPPSRSDDRTKPPQDIPPGKLFRLLLRRPRPVWRLDYRLTAAPAVPLYARGLTAAERAMVRDADDGDRELVFLSVALSDAAGAPFFATPDAAGTLLAHEAAELEAALMPALRICSPSVDVVDPKAWGDALRKGAMEPASAALVAQIRAAFDTHDVLKKPIRPRMDLYFGLPLADITDGQRMAFLAAFHLYDR